MIKILTVFGTRPEAIKMAPLVLALGADESFESKLCVTGQHRQMLDQALEIFELKPDFDLDLMRTNQNLHELSARIIMGMKRVFREFLPDIVLVHGDTLTTFCVSLAAFYEKIGIGHVEAGLRTHDLQAPWPEEANRKLSSVLADIHFAPTIQSKQNLLDEGQPSDSVHVTGNTVIDALFWMKRKIVSSPDFGSKFQKQFSYLDEYERLILITGHRRENFGDGIKNICLAIQTLAKKYPEIGFVFPVHLNPNVQVPVEKLLCEFRNIHLVEPLDYRTFVHLMLRSYLILTDSGGIQEEAPALGKPVLVMRDTTERPEAVDAGTVRLVGTNVHNIVSGVSTLLENTDAYELVSHAHNPYGDGNAVQKIIDVLKGNQA